MTGRAAVGLVRIPLSQLPLGGQQKLWLPVQASSAGYKVCRILLAGHPMLSPMCIYARLEQVDCPCQGSLRSNCGHLKAGGCMSSWPCAPVEKLWCQLKCQHS